MACAQNITQPVTIVMASLPSTPHISVESTSAASAVSRSAVEADPALISGLSSISDPSAISDSSMGQMFMQSMSISDKALADDPD